MTQMIELAPSRGLSFSRVPLVMGVLNVTPDSFSDGGQFDSVEAAIDHGVSMVASGVAIVDVGGESTRPRGRAYGAGASGVPASEELERVLPVISGLRKSQPSLVISIDTWKPEVARAALQAGADIVNNVLGLIRSPEMATVVRESGAPIILNHCRGTPATTFAVSKFTDVVSEVARDLREASEWFVRSGILKSRVWPDPGLGFGKTHEESFTLLAHLDTLCMAGGPVVAGASRKAFLGSLAGHPPQARLPESLAAAAFCCRFSRQFPVILRVHDAAETVRLLNVLKRLEMALPEHQSSC